MAIKRSMTRNKNHDDKSSSSKTIKADNVWVGPWSYLNHDMLLLVMMQLGVIDFVAFNGVCKSWRSVALDNWKRFMASQPPMLMQIFPYRNNDKICFLEDYEGRMFKTTLTHSAGMGYLGLTSGYLILSRYKTNDFWLVNLITRHELIFPPVPCLSVYLPVVTGVLVFSPSISRLVFVVLANKKIWFSIVGEGSWNCVSSTFDFTFKDVLAFKGKIYILNSNGHLCELTLNPEPKVTLLETKNLLDADISFPQLVSWGESLYVAVIEDIYFEDVLKVYKRDSGEMEWVPLQDTGVEHAFFLSVEGHVAAGKPELWADRYGRTNESGYGRCFRANQYWYFPHECLNVNLLDES